MGDHGGKGLLPFGQLRSRAMDSHGGKAPIPPLWGRKIEQEESLCGGQRMGEHLPSGRLTDSGACGAVKFRRLSIRV